MTDFVTLTAFAALRGVSKAAVTKWKAQGLVVLVDGKVDVIASTKLLAERASPRRGGRPKAELLGASRLSPDDPATWTTAEATRRERIAIAKLRELELAEKAGKVSAIEEVAQKVGKRFSVVRARLLALPSALAPRLAHTSAADCARVLDDAIRDALTELAS
jgi:phage terminase Nu1 subunit (DNA packaging protein)